MKKVFAIMLALVLALGILAACSGDTSSSTGTSSSSGSSSQPADSSVGGDDGGIDLSAQEPVTLEVYAITFGSNLDSLPAVNKAVNDYVQPLLNIEVNLHIMDFASANQQLNLMMSGSEPVDLMISSGRVITAYYAQGALNSLEDAINTYGQGIVEMYGDGIMDACRLGGDYYMVPSGLPSPRTVGFIYSEAINQQYGLGLENAKNLDDIEACLAKLKEEAPEVVGVFGNSSLSFFGLWDWDDLGNTYGVLMNGGNNLDVVNLYETDKYRQLCEQMHDWYQKGYIYSEAATSAITLPDMFKAGNTLGQFSGVTAYSDEQHSQMFGTEIRHVTLTEGFIATAPIQQSAWVVPHNATDPDRSVQFLNLMVTDPYLSNLLTYGIEGEDYRVVDAANDVIGYVEGRDANTKTWDNSMGWTWGPKTIQYIWEGEQLDIRELTMQDIDNAKYSKAAGFTFDPTDVENELTACANVYARYGVGLECGSVDPAVVLPEFINELKAAGVDTIIAAKQAQLDAWALENGAA